jgi:hypothetical protein
MTGFPQQGDDYSSQDIINSTIQIVKKQIHEHITRQRDYGFVRFLFKIGLSPLAVTTHGRSFVTSISPARHVTESLMNKYLSTSFLIFLLTACTPTPTTIPPAISTSNEPVAVPVTPTLPVVISTPLIQPTEIASTVSDLSGNLWLQVISPQDEAIVDTAHVEVIGSAPAGAVISVNDEIMLVPDDGEFQAVVSLEDGPNLIEIIASDASGNETSLLLTVTYDP